MMAMVVLVCGVMAVTDSYRTILQAERQGREEYHAALLLEGRMLEMEMTERASTMPETDPLLGPILWKVETQETAAPNCREQRLIMTWGEEKKSHALDLSTYLAG